MTRKRFVKLLMAEGYSRNDANEHIELVLARKGSYKRAYNAILFAKHMDRVGAISKKTAEALLFATQALKVFGDKCKKAAQRRDFAGKKTSILLCDDLEATHE